jgi:hypothetical protein
MRKFIQIVIIWSITIVVFSCKKDILVTSISQIPGTWRWESTCGGANDTCYYRTENQYATLEFRSDGKYVEKRNDTLYLQTTYTLINSDETFGTLVLDNPLVSYPITIMDNMLLVTRGSYIDGYRKIK